MILTETQELEIKLAATEQTLAELKTVVANRIFDGINQDLRNENATLRSALVRLVKAEEASVELFGSVQISALETAMKHAHWALGSNVKGEPTAQQTQPKREGS